MAAQEEQEAAEFLEDAVRRFPADPDIRLLYASILWAVRPEDVAVEAGKAVELGPDDPSILVRAAHLQLSRGQVAIAQDYATRARTLVRPDFIFMSGLLNLEGRLAALQGADDLAEEKLRSAVDSDPGFSSFSADLARFLADRDRQDEALDVIEKGLAHTDHRDELEHLKTDIEADAARS
jgi:Flp pilus assembly protein TadD